MLGYETLWWRQFFKTQYCILRPGINLNCHKVPVLPFGDFEIIKSSIIIIFFTQQSKKSHTDQSCPLCHSIFIFDYFCKYQHSWLLLIVNNSHLEKREIIQRQIIIIVNKLLNKIHVFEVKILANFCDMDKLDVTVIWQPQDWQPFPKHSFMNMILTTHT